MDASTFDRFTVAISRPPTRRAALRLLAGGVLAGLLASRSAGPARAAQRLDSDQDGLFDDDEVNVYGTNPDTSDSDGDDRPDGQEIADGTDPLTPDGVVAPPADDGEGTQPDEDGGAPPMGTSKALGEICTPGVDTCIAGLQCGTPTTRHTCSGTVAGVSAWCCLPPGGICTECGCCGDFYCEFDDNNVGTCQPNPEG